MQRTAQLAHQLAKINTAIEQACRRSGRDSRAVSLMAVTKYASDEDVLALLQTGQVKHIGESRVQQAIKRWTQPRFAAQPVCKHLIGHLQTNKAAQAVDFFDFIDSVDSLHLAQVLEQQAAKRQKTLPILLQIKLTQRESQSGIALTDAPALLHEVKACTHLRPCGYMAIAPQTQNTDELLRLFTQVAQAFERDFPPTQERYLSLGMSEDFQWAVQAGSTLPRIGSGLFETDLEEV